MQVSRERLGSLTTAAYAAAAAFVREGGGAAGADVCRTINGIIDAEIAALAADGAAAACAPGCNFCCHLRVEVFPHEARALALELRTRIEPALAAQIEQRIRANAARIDALTAAQHRSARLPCAFLVEGRCSAHEVRPAACAAYHSLSRERCERTFDTPEHIGTPRGARPALLELQVLGSALIEAAQAGYVASGAAGGQTELHQALRESLGDVSSL